ncbi:hypothetical protein HNP72_001944 [Sphingobacterium soli]|nr:hypothetical protein [Sphingobacterium soli]
MLLSSVIFNGQTGEQKVINKSLLTVPIILKVLFEHFEKGSELFIK